MKKAASSALILCAWGSVLNREFGLFWRISSNNQLDLRLQIWYWLMFPLVLPKAKPFINLGCLIALLPGGILKCNSIGIKFLPVDSRNWLIMFDNAKATLLS